MDLILGKQMGYTADTLAQVLSIDPTSTDNDILALPIVQIHPSTFGQIVQPLHGVAVPWHFTSRTSQVVIPTPPGTIKPDPQLELRGSDIPR